jgi:hypothetical protein
MKPVSLRELVELWVVLDAGLVSPETWRAWADRRIDAWPAVPVWLYELSRAEGSSEAATALLSAINAPDQDREQWPDEVSLRIGALYLLCERHLIDVGRMLDSAGRIADGANLASPQCEEFYALANRAEAGIAADLLRDIDELFSKHASAARLAAKSWATSGASGTLGAA